MLSVVQHKDAGMEGVLVVRARDKQTLEKLLPEQVPIETEYADYRHRVFVTRSRIAALLEDQVRGIDYCNFKSSVIDDELHDAYMGCWSIMAQYQARRTLSRGAGAGGRLQRVLDFASRVAGRGGPTGLV
jgi:hypothetical protein